MSQNHFEIKRKINFNSLSLFHCHLSLVSTSSTSDNVCAIERHLTYREYYLMASSHIHSKVVLCVHDVCMHMFVCVYMNVCMCVGQRLLSDALTNQSPFFLRWDLNPELIDFTRSIGQLAQDILLSLCSQHNTQLLCGFLAPRLRFSCLKDIFQLIHLLSPNVFF